MTQARDPSLSPPLDATRLRMVMWLVTGAMFMEILDGSIIATALPDMARTFGTSALELNIGISAYLLALGVFIPVSGWVADRVGARTVFAWALALFTATSALCALSTDLRVFVALRVLQGMSGAMMVPVGRLVVIRLTPKERLMAALQSLVWPALIAPVLGPPLGGFITTHFGWHWIFYLNVPLGLLALVLALKYVPDIAGQERKAFDWPGFLLSGVGMFLLLSALERLTVHADAASVLTLVLGCLLLGLAVRHFRRAPAPMIGLGPFRQHTFVVAARGGALLRAATGSVPFLLPLMLQVGFGLDAFRAGLLVLCVFAGNLAMKTVTTPLLRRFGYRPLMVWNGLLCMVSVAACALIGPDTPLALTVPLLVFSGMVRSMQFTTNGTLAYADMPKEHMSDANGLFNTVVQLTMAASVTLAAICTRAAQFLCEWWGWTSPGADYRLAFVLIALIGLLGLIDPLRLPRGAGDHFLAR
jgi:EmrB/QacA subfamily drug resistance transporter